MRHMVSVLVENKFGVLARISTLFAARGFNIDSLSVGETEDPAISRMTIVVKSDASILEQVTKQLNKLVDIIKVNDFNDCTTIERGLALIKINVTKSCRDEIIGLIGMFRARIVDISQDSIVTEITGDEDKIDAFMKVIMPYGIKETNRTGIVALARGNTNKVK
ncbi:acetolactate synthase small subunit [Endomicrobiia bacterium]|nr:acetolactate synthase small subunit [Endomicrobiia bacterium]